MLHTMLAALCTEHGPDLPEPVWDAICASYDELSADARSQVDAHLKTHDLPWHVSTRVAQAALRQDGSRNDGLQAHLQRHDPAEVASAVRRGISPRLRSLLSTLRSLDPQVYVALAETCEGPLELVDLARTSFDSTMVAAVVSQMTPLGVGFRDQLSYVNAASRKNPAAAAELVANHDLADELVPATIHGTAGPRLGGLLARRSRLRPDSPELAAALDLAAIVGLLDEDARTALTQTPGPVAAAAQNWAPGSPLVTARQALMTSSDPEELESASDPVVRMLNSVLGSRKVYQKLNAERWAWVLAHNPDAPSGVVKFVEMCGGDTGLAFRYLPAEVRTRLFHGDIVRYADFLRYFPDLLDGLDLADMDWWQAQSPTVRWSVSQALRDAGRALEIPLSEVFATGRMLNPVVAHLVAELAHEPDVLSTALTLFETFPGTVDGLISAARNLT